MSDYHTEARWRVGDPDTSEEAAIAVSPFVTEAQALVERYAIRAGPEGFNDAQLGEDLKDDTSTLRTRRAELADRNIVLDSGRRNKHGDSERRRIVWIHRSFDKSPPPVVDAPERATNEERAEARAMVGELYNGARQMRLEGRAAWADQLNRAAELMAKLAR